jgi:alpha-mannosidase
MKGCGVNYFLTTKINWGDTNTFPMTTFYWQGIDGTKVLTHFNRIHVGPTPETLHDMTDGNDGIREKRVAPLRLFSFGKGDGGGGPEFEMLENARRLSDLDGVPRTGYTSVSDFMKRLEKEAVRPSTWAGELYLELHRGTLTNQHDIKRNNRKAEIALHNLEAATVLRAVKEGEDASEDSVRPLMQKLLVNQFHDILPGTCINRAHVESRAQTGRVIEEARRMTKDLLCEALPDRLTLTNTLSFERTDPVSVPFEGKYVKGDYPQQVYTDLDGRETLLLMGVLIPAFGSVTLELTDEAPAPA